MTKHRWCSEDPSHYNPRAQEVCGLCGAPFVRPDPGLEGLIRRCPFCASQNLIHGERVGLHGVCERCGRLLALCSQDGTLIAADHTAAGCPQCGSGYIIPAPDLWGQAGGGSTRPNSTPERLFADVDRLVTGWPSWLGFHNPATREPYSVAAPILARGLVLVQDGNRSLHAVDLLSGSPLYPAYPAFGEGSYCSGPSAAGEYCYSSGPPGRLAAFALSRMGQEDLPPGEDPVPDYGIDLHRGAGELWESFRPPTANEASGRVVCLWRTAKLPHRYRITATTLDLAQRLPQPNGDYPDGPWEWDLELDGQPLGQPVVTDSGSAFLLLDPDRLLRIRNGEITEFGLSAPIRDACLYAPELDLLVVNTVHGELLAVQGETLAEVWRRRGSTGVELVGPGCYVPGRTAAEDAEIWAVDLDGHAEAVRARDGILVSGFPKLESISQVTAPPSACGDALLVPMGHDLILARRSGRTSILLATVPTPMGRITHQPAIGHERVVVATDRWKVMAYRVPEGASL